MRLIILCVVGIIILVGILVCLRPLQAKKSLFKSITSIEQLSKILPQTPEALKQMVAKAMYDAQIAIAQIIAIADDKRTYENTVAAFDQLAALSDLTLLGNIASTLESLSPNDALREAAHASAIEIRTFFVEQVMHNETLFKAFKAYVEGNGVNATLNDEQRYFMTETMRNFERAGMLLPADKRAELLALDKELTQLCAEFDK